MVSVRGTASTINNQTPHLITRHSQAPLFRIRIAPGGCEEIQSQPLGIIRGHSGDAQELHHVSLSYYSLFKLCLLRIKRGLKPYGSSTTLAD